MAIYDLKCEKCGHTFELFVKGLLEEEDKKCPKCGSLKVGQKFSSFATLGHSDSDQGGCSSPPSSGFG